MDNKELERRINEANAKMLPDAEEVTKTEEVVETPTPQDLYRAQQNQFREAKPVQARGANPRIRLDISALTDTGLSRHYKKEKEDSDYYKKIGDNKRAQMIRQQYMQDYFLPAVDAMVKLNGMEAVLNNQEILDTLDGLTLLDGTNGKGYTVSFIRSMYTPDEMIERTDNEVADALKQITMLCEQDEIRAAKGLAQAIKQKIDSGQNIATIEDYSVIEKVALV